LRKRLLLAAVALMGCVCFSAEVNAQMITVNGTVYDQTGRRPIEAVAVFSTSGRGAITDSLGNYSITVPRKDSIWFSLIGKSTMKYAVDTMFNTNSFNVMIHVYATQLPEVRVRNNYYKLDSVQNRIDNAKAFNFRKPSLRTSSNPNYNPGGLTAGFDLNAIINMFRTKYNRNMGFLQKRLLEQEQDGYINRRFSKLFVRKLTKLESPQLEEFMKLYRPDYELLTVLNDLELGKYIQEAFELYKAERPLWQGRLKR
jgi:hypothetical protein